MNKKLNTIAFILVATLANILIMIIFTLVPMILFWQLIAKNIPQSVAVIISMLILTGAIVGTFVTYNAIMKKIIDNIELDKYFDPLFKSMFRKK